MTQDRDTKQRPWTTGEISILRAEGHRGAADLAAMFDRSERSVRSAAHRWRVSLRRRGSRSGVLLGQPHGVSLARRLRSELVDNPRLAELIVRRLEIDRDAAICPGCGRRPISNEKTGLCAVCHLRKLTEAHRDALAELEAHRELDAAKQMLHRARKELGDGA